MISKLGTIEDIFPMYTAYLQGMSQHYNIHDLDGWLEAALKNLKKNESANPVFIIQEADEIMGFAMVSTHLRFNDQGRAIAEFHIQKDHGRNGYGRSLAEFVFDQFPGQWEVALTLKNTGAMGFWKQVVSSYTSGDFVEKNKPSTDMYGFLFENTYGFSI